MTVREFMSSVYTALVAVVLVLVASFGVVVTANVAHASIACPSGPKFCTYWDVQASGALYYYTGPTNGSCIEIGAPWDNNISSVKNNFAFHKVTLYGSHGCSGGACTIGVNQGLNLSPPGCYNDWASSLRIYPA